jgi:GNAT superfamily N-acetyltransferase
MQIQIAKVTAESLMLKSSTTTQPRHVTLLKNLCQVTNEVIAQGSGIGWTHKFDDPIQELMPYWQTQASTPNVDLLVAYRIEHDNDSEHDSGAHHVQALGSIQLVTHKTNPRSSAIAHRGELACFFSHPSYRKSGIGYQLLCAAEAVARDDHDLVKLTLDCRSTQHGAIALYERCGYRRWGTMSNYASMDGKVMYDGHFYEKDLN